MKFKNLHSALIALTLLLLMISPAHAGFLDHDNNKKPPIKDPVPSRFSVCYQHTCTMIDHVGLSHPQWQGVRERFSPAAANAEQERRQIASAIAYLEIEVGGKINSLDDRGGNLEGVFKAKGNQLDCIDESTNSTTYMTMMERDGLLKFHSVQPRATRGFFIMGWPHSTAVIKDNATDRRWAVDSWFFDNGTEPTIVMLKKWRTGWSPEGAKH
jgi:hypothetical protein